MEENQIKSRNKKWLDLFIVILIIALLSFMVYVVNFMKSESRECLKNPFIYGAEKMGGVSCTCTQFIEGKNLATFGFDEEKFISNSFSKPLTSKYEDLNFSAILKLLNKSENEE